MVHGLFQKATCLWTSAPKLVVQPVLGVAIFGIGSNYDKDSRENASMACARLTIKGVRTALVTNSMQLIGFMARRGLQGPITEARMASHWRGMPAQLTTEYAKARTLFGATVAAGDMIYIPFGSVIGGRARDVNIGCRFGLLLKQLYDTNLVDGVDKKIEESTLTNSSPTVVITASAKQRQATKLSILQASKAIIVPECVAPKSDAGASRDG